jgi:hypothetical protein
VGLGSREENASKTKTAKKKGRAPDALAPFVVKAKLASK